MRSAVKDQLRRLIKSLTKSEKRNFKLFAKRVGSNADSKFVQLFDLIDAQETADDEALLLQVADGQPGKLSNLKRHLYQQVLVSLRLVHINKQTDIQIRQQIDFARILYGKGHYLDALRLLERIRSLAEENNYDLLLLEILEFQKLIEARHVTRSRQVKNKMDMLVRDATKRTEIALHASLHANINIQIQGYYILRGHVRTPEHLEHFTVFWEATGNKLRTYPAATPTFFAKINRYQANMWRHYILLNFENALESALNAYNLFRIESDMPLHDPDLFMRMLYYVNAFAYLTEDKSHLEQSTNQLGQFIANKPVDFNPNSKRIGFIYHELALLNISLSKRDWPVIEQRATKIIKHKEFPFHSLPDHRRNLFRYKFAAAAFGQGHFDTCLDYLAEIMNSQLNLLREDLLINTRLLRAMAYFESGEFYLADYAVTNLSRILRRNKYAGQVHSLALTALRKLLREEKNKHTAIFSELQDSISKIKNDPFEAKTLRFLDVFWWAEGKC